MHNSTTQTIIIFVIASSLLILLLIFFIAVIIYRYQQKQNDYFRSVEEMNATHHNALLQSQVEMQEQTFQNISREIHDNIGQKLTLAKLQLNTLHFDAIDETRQEVSSVVHTIGQVINDLSDISRSMSSEIILDNGLIKALEFELAQLEKSGLYRIGFSVTGNTIFLDSSRELVLFRVTQEALHNIIKHAQATQINVGLHYNKALLSLAITDNGKGFDINELKNTGTGIKNMQKRILMLNGTCVVSSNFNTGTEVNIQIPFI
jgi:two-component system, NarL family, sensor kinase